ncbi:MAG TPA: hypothetical protein PKM88_03335 [bacterium]|nr:hypothetical protein [bacterium]
MTLLAADFFTRVRAELERQVHGGEVFSLVLLAAPATALAQAALRGTLRSVDMVMAPSPLLLAALLPETPAAGAQVVAGRVCALLAAQEAAVLTFPPYDAAPLADAAAQAMQAGDPAWAAGTLAQAAQALRGFAAHAVAAAQRQPRLRRHDAAVGTRELHAYLDYEIRRCRRYHQEFALGICAPALADRFDRVLREVARDTALGDVFGILEGGRMFVFCYQTGGQSARRLAQALRRRFELAADDPALRVAGFPDDAATPEEFIAIIDPGAGLLKESERGHHDQE